MGLVSAPIPLVLSHNKSILDLKEHLSRKSTENITKYRLGVGGVPVMDQGQIPIAKEVNVVWMDSI